MKYKIEITETLQKTVEVEASDRTEALDKVKNMYYSEKIWLMSDDITDTTIEFVEE